MKKVFQTHNVRWFGLTKFPAKLNKATDESRENVSHFNKDIIKGENKTEKV